MNENIKGEKGGLEGERKDEEDKKGEMREGTKRRRKREMRER